MAWTDTLDDDQRKEIAFARMYAVHFADDTAPVASYLMPISALAELLDQHASDLQLARLAALDDRPPLDGLIAAARAAGAAGTWELRGAQHAALIYTHDAYVGDAMASPDTSLWPVLELTPPHGLVVLIRIQAGDGGEPGITFYGKEEES